MRGLSIKRFAAFAAGLFLVSAASGQEQKAPIKNPTLTRYVRCGALVQPESGKVQRNVLITIQGERIQQVQENAQAPAGAQVIDLSDHTCLPGLIDTHTHTLLQGDITAADYDEQLLKQSTAYRAILGTRSVRRALDYGFTTIRSGDGRRRLCRCRFKEGHQQRNHSRPADESRYPRHGRYGRLPAARIFARNYGPTRGGDSGRGRKWPQSGAGADQLWRGLDQGIFRPQLFRASGRSAG